jgi:hypothetical protein
MSVPGYGIEVERACVQSRAARGALNTSLEAIPSSSRALRRRSFSRRLIVELIAWKELAMLRRLLLLVSLACMMAPGCSKNDSAPADCAGGYECPDRVSDCGNLPYPERPECEEACYEGRCCERRDGEWSVTILDCQRSVDAGTDAMVDAMQDAGAPQDAGATGTQAATR